MKDKDAERGSMQQAQPNRIDVELASAAAAGSDDARRELAERVLDRIRTTVRYLCGDHADASDITQQCLVEVLRSAGSFQGLSRLETWADRITVRTAMRLLRRRRQQEARFRTTELPEAATTDTPEAALDRTRVQASMANLLQKLTPERRTVLTLQIVYGYSIREIVELTEAPPETVRDRLKVGKKQLRRLILTDDALREWAKDVLP
ncbi:MAG: sigma-70 family RNA polymerase sigma factor [bacterium]